LGGGWGGGGPSRTSPLVSALCRRVGISILTTNFERGIDDAFKRRIRFRVGFEQPDAPTHAQLWRALLPESPPLSDDVDIDTFARAYDLSGGHIKEVIVRATACALGQAQPALQRALLKRCADLEYKKIGKLAVAARGKIC
jgi:SpoVK/Ycf46/Vps4 family AAA+-type ATPase